MKTGHSSILWLSIRVRAGVKVRGVETLLLSSCLIRKDSCAVPFFLPDCVALDAPASLAERTRTSVGKTDKCQRRPRVSYAQPTIEYKTAPGQYHLSHTKDVAAAHLL